MDDAYIQQIDALEKRLKVMRQTELQGIADRRSSVRSTLDTLSVLIEDLRIVGEDLQQQSQELIRTQSMLDREQQRYRDILDFIPDAHLVTDTEGRILEANRAASYMLSRTPEALVGGLLDQFVDPDECLPYRAALNEVVHGEDRVNCEIGMCTAEGKTFQASVTAAAEYDSEGMVAELRWMIRDLSEQKAAEAELRRYADLIRQIHGDLERFTQVASHDLQEPIRTLVSYSQLLARRYRGRLDSDADDFLDFIVDGATHMQTLINDLLEYSRVTSRRGTLLPTDSEQVLGRALDKMRSIIQEQGVVVTHDPLPLVLADGAQLEQVFSSLLGNAIKFRGKEPPKIHVGACLNERNWLFSVSDNGIGIDPHYYDRIFVIFQRLHNRTAYPGTGIGLPLAKRIIERHGGRMWVQSEPGRGSTFYFTIPVQAPPPPRRNE